MSAEENEDQLPVVILDHDADVAALPAITTSADGGDLDISAQDYLRAQGISDPATWAAFRLGQVDEATLARLLTPTQRRQMRPHGIWLPTWDPRTPDLMAGLIRLTPAQNIHRFLTPPVGLACAPDLAMQPRVVLVDNPLLGLRLHAAGARGIAIVEDPAVLAPLTDWLAARQIVTIATARNGLIPLPTGITPVGTARIGSRLSLVDPAILALVGIDPAAVAEPEVTVPITPLLLAQLHAFAQERITAGEATLALRTLEADHADLVRSYRVGFLPSDFRQALSRDHARALHGLSLGTSLILPATDVQGAIVDLLVVQARDGGGSNVGCFAEPRGLLGGDLIGSTNQIIVTDTFRWLARLMGQGYRNVLLLRGVADAELNAERIASAGVRQVVVRCRRDSEVIAAALNRAGMQVRIESGPITGDDWITPKPALTIVEPETMPVIAMETAKPTVAPVPPIALVPVAPPPAIAVEPTPAAPEIAAPAEPTIGMTVQAVEFNTERSLALFEVGPVRYAIEMAEHDLPTRQVVARSGTSSHQDRINLSIPAQCRRFAASASRRLGVDHQRIEAHLADAWRQLQAHEAKAGLPPPVAIEDNERAAAEATLRDPALLSSVSTDLAALGWVGENRSKNLLYLTAVSRLLPDPLWSVYRATAGAAPWKSLGILAALMPPEECVVFHRLTETLLKSSDPRALRHRLLLIDQAEALRPEGAVALRCLREWGSIGWQQVAKAEGAGSAGLMGEARGPVAVLAAAGGDLDARCRDCFLTVTVDESPEQTARMLEAQRRQHGQAKLPDVEAQAIIRRHHAIQRMLRPATVVIPFSDRIAFPMTSVRHRDEQAAFLNLISASALLHQFQRQRDAQGAILADELDFQHAVAAAGHLLGQSGDGLSSQSRHLLQRLFATGMTTFTLPDLGGLVPDWTYYTYRACADELVQMGYCTAAGGGQGKKRTYTRAAEASAVPGITLLPAGSSTDKIETFRPFVAFCDGSKGVTPVAKVG